MDETVAKYRRLDSQEIINTVKALHVRIERRFPESGLGKISAELLRVADENAIRVCNGFKNPISCCASGRRR